MGNRFSTRFLWLLVVGLGLLMASCNTRRKPKVPPGTTYKHFAWMEQHADGTFRGLGPISKAEAKGRRHYRFVYRHARLISVQYRSGRGHTFEARFLIPRDGAIEHVVRRQGIERRTVERRDKKALTRLDVRHLDTHGQLVQREAIRLNNRAWRVSGTVYAPDNSVVKRWKVRYSSKGFPLMRWEWTRLGRLRHYQKWGRNSDNVWTSHIKRELKKPNIRETRVIGTNQLPIRKMIFHDGRLFKDVRYNKRGDYIRIAQPQRNEVNYYSYDATGKPHGRIRHLNGKIRSRWKYVWSAGGRLLEEQQVTGKKKKGPLVRYVRSYDDRGFLKKFTRIRYGEKYQEKLVTYVAPGRHSTTLFDYKIGQPTRKRLITIAKSGEKEQRTWMGSKLVARSVTLYEKGLIKTATTWQYDKTPARKIIKSYFYDKKGRRIGVDTTENKMLSRRIRTTFDKGRIAKTITEQYLGGKLTIRDISVPIREGADKGKQKLTRILFKDGKESGRSVLTVDPRRGKRVKTPKKPEPKKDPKNKPEPKKDPKNKPEPKKDPKNKPEPKKDPKKKSESKTEKS